MNAEEFQNMFLSQQAILIYEIILFSVLSVLTVILAKKRKDRKKEREIRQGQQERKALDAALGNQRKRS